MHETRYRGRRLSFLSIIILGLGIYFLLQFTWFDVRFVPIMVSLVFLLFILPAIISSRRHRRTRHPSYERKQYEIYTPTPSPYKPADSYERTEHSASYSERQDFSPTMKKNPSVINIRPNFCNFCGIIVLIVDMNLISHFPLFLIFQI
ncbi:MAG: hypothetical protein HGN29_15550 [Asgard group archaeon]|nr:hypothetical protein [Asgard group archaeon]